MFYIIQMEKIYPDEAGFFLLYSESGTIWYIASILCETISCKSNRKATDRNWNNQKQNPAFNTCTKMGNK